MRRAACGERQAECSHRGQPIALPWSGASGARRKTPRSRALGSRSKTMTVSVFSPPREKKSPHFSDSGKSGEASKKKEKAHSSPFSLTKK